MTLRLLSIPATLLHVHIDLPASSKASSNPPRIDTASRLLPTTCFLISRHNIFPHRSWSIRNFHGFDGILDLNLLEPLKLTPEIIDAMEPRSYLTSRVNPTGSRQQNGIGKNPMGSYAQFVLNRIIKHGTVATSLLCLTCGAIDEHITRQCPVSLVCHSCGSRGHLSRHCPSSSRVAGSRCARCDSTIHLTLVKLPSIWRAYDEESNDRPKRVLRACYYCGDTGDHFGDECPFRRSSLHTEPSAFSDRSIPKRDSHSTRHQQPHRSRRDSSPRHRDSDRHRDGRRHDNYRSHDPPPSYKKYNNRSGRTDKAAYARRAETDEEEDWFSRRNQRENHKKSGSSSRSSGGPSRSSGVPSNSSGASCRPSGSKSKSSRIGGSYKGGYIK
ncbi:hypothetical protein KEM48_005567 [Puccinia striiformis f. sp. tritici PST-130]|nr:hypothetical protein KEM48_005567 [Puccinia striiformis f. sp. tritici PST-130]